jgi:hypothetical protein
MSRPAETGTACGTEISASVDIHVLLEEFEAIRGGDNLDGGHEREVRDGAVASDEVDDVAS